MRAAVNSIEGGDPTPYDAFQWDVTFKRYMTDHHLVKNEEGVQVITMAITGVVDSHDCEGGAEKVL